MSETILVTWDEDAGGYQRAGNAACTARWASAGRNPDGSRHVSGDICGQPAPHGPGDFRACDYHLKRLDNWCDDRRAYREAAGIEEINAVAAHRRLKLEEHYAEAERLYQEARARHAMEEPGRVYFIQRLSDGLIKIGTSQQVETRFATLRWEHGPIRPLLIIPGSHQVEHGLHGEFKALRVAGEWFRPGVRLLKRIGDMRRDPQYAELQIGEPVPAREIRETAPGKR